jgi:hypothetical protein
MSEVQAFASSDPEVVTVWDEATAEYAAWRERLRTSKIDGRDFWTIDNWGVTQITGIARRENETAETYPEGWAKLKANDYLTPNRRTKAGKVAREWMASLKGVDVMSKLKQFGVPRDSMSIDGAAFDGHVYSPGVHKYGDTLYVIWDERAKWTGNKVFTPVSLSEYYAAKEAAVS